MHKSLSDVPLTRSRSAVTVAASYVGHRSPQQAPLFAQVDYFTRSPSPALSSQGSRSSIHDKPYDDLSPEVYSRAADLLTSLDKQPTGAAAQRRAAAYAAMTLPQVQAAVQCALQSSNWSPSYLFRSAMAFFCGLNMAEESVIAIRELCRRGHEPAAYGAELPATRR